MFCFFNTFLFQVPEYGKSLEESAIIENSFQLIFAFDEIVALGYRESVNLAQINTFIQMDSHDEKVAIALREVRCNMAIKGLTYLVCMCAGLLIQFLGLCGRE